MAAKDWAHEDGVDMASWQAALAGAAAWEPDLGAGSGASGLVEGAAEGILYGGCLSILAASLGTPYEIHTEGTILFMEDVAAKPYQIDRMLMQLKLAGKLDGVRGIIFGEMLDCLQSAKQEYTLEEVVLRIVGSLGVPVALWSAVGARDGREHHTADRGAGWSDGAGWAGEFENLGSGSDQRRKQNQELTAKDAKESAKDAKKKGRDGKHERNKTHSSDRHLRDGDGGAGGDAEAARVSRHRVGRGGVSANVGLSGGTRHSGGAAF